MRNYFVLNARRYQKFEVITTHNERIYTCTECGYQYGEPAKVRNAKHHHLALDEHRWR